MARTIEARPIRRGSAIRAKDFNALRQANIESAPLDAAGKRNRHEPIYWIGQITPTGPVVPLLDEEGQPTGDSSDPMPDFADARYWVRQCVGTTTKVFDGPTGPPLAKPDVETAIHPQNNFDLRGDFNPLPQGRSGWTAAINLNELDQATHNLPWGTIVRVETWDFRSGLTLAPSSIAPELRGTTWNVFAGPYSISLEVKIEKVIANSGDPSGIEAQREQNYLAYFGPYFKVRRMIRPQTGNPSQAAVVDFAQWLVALPMRNIDITKFKNGSAQIYNINTANQPTFLASNGARGLTLYHLTAATPLVTAPTPSQLCPTPALEAS